VTTVILSPRELTGPSRIDAFSNLGKAANIAGFVSFCNGEQEVVGEFTLAVPNDFCCEYFAKAKTNFPKVKVTLEIVEG